MCALESINKEPWFHGLLPREEVRLLILKNGDFLVRMTEPNPGQSRQLVLSIMQSEGEEHNEGMHYVIRMHDGQYSVTEKKSFFNLQSLVGFYRHNRISDEVPTSICLNPIGRQKWELNHEDVIMTKTLGEGAFGEVKLGTLRHANGEIEQVAVKVAKLEKCTKEQIKEIMTEARLMRHFDHRNVVRCHGVAAVEEPLLVVMEFVQGGGLDSFLSKNNVLMAEKMDIIAQVAAGLAYIHKQNIMHRDIAARNVLYGCGTAKVSDFGLSRVGTSYHMDPNKKAPIRWLSPETLTSFIYTQLTDVFSFGVLCWEVIENGEQPYPGLLVLEVHQKVVRDDYRMIISDKAPFPLQEMIKKCWLRDVNQRPNMEQVHLMCCKFVDRRDAKTSPDQASAQLSGNGKTKDKEKEKDKGKGKGQGKAGGGGRMFLKKKPSTPAGNITVKSIVGLKSKATKKKK
uniref:Tyrosine-protein kinase n=1 Tax=Caenorhabditis japonica TaxID=281687 RepID=A0A8R1HVJ7_CAEJA